MTNAVAYRLENPQRSAPLPVGRRGALVLLTWLAVVIPLAAAGAFAGPPENPPVALFIAAAGPVIVFLVAMRTSRAFRDSVLAANLALIAGMQAWRFVGFGFLALWAHGLLPGYFAWPAGLGDMAIAFVAPWMALTVLQRPAFAADRTFVAWNILGIVDLVVAVGLAALVPLVLGQSTDYVDSGIMARLPLALIPAYLVPASVILHLTALAQSGHVRRRE